jgi:dGTPase
MDAGALAVMHDLRDFMFERVYLRAAMAPQRNRAKDIVRGLVGYYIDHPAEMPDSYRHADADTLTQVIDDVAGMTDRFAIRRHDELFRPRLF